MTLPGPDSVQVSLPAALLAEVRTDIEAMGRRAPVSLRRLRGYLVDVPALAVLDQPPASDKSMGERPVPS